MTVTVVMHGTLRRFLPEGVARAAPAGRKRRSVPCITTVTVTVPPPSPAA